jgi:acetolactate synthase-1/2/3 large subunit
MQIKVSELIVGFLESLGVDIVFGMPGAHVLPVYDALYDSKIQSILAKHEQGASFMAGGHTKASGKITACIATAGPGATNLVTGIANAYADNQPIVVITGETPTHIYGKGGLQESSGEGGTFDQVALFRHITRYSRSLQRTDYLAQVLTQASKALLSVNPGPVLLSIPFNVQNEWVDAKLLDNILIHSGTRHLVRWSWNGAEHFLKLLDAAKHPVIIAGYGAICSGASQAVVELSAQYHIPVATSLKGKGVIDEHSEWSLGSLGVTSSGIAYQYIAENADLLIILGASFNERTSYLWDAALLKERIIIQVDNNPNQLSKVFTADLEICDDINQVITSLLLVMRQQGIDTQSRLKSSQTLRRIKQASNNDYAMFCSGFSLIEAFYRKLAQHFINEEIRVFDDNMIFAQNFYDVPHQHHYYSNSGISSLGNAVPAAIGAQFAHQLPSFAILGDGGFQMCCMEIMTAVNYDKPLNVVLLNNSTLGLIRKNQHQLYQQRHINCDFINPDFASLARSFEINYKSVTSPDDLDDLFEHYDLKNTINLIDITMDKNTYPNYSSKR